MGKKCKCPDAGAGEIPSWFMTYSDVITLLMTFFILLLTFSTNEPEFFAKVQVVAFGGGGSTGMAAESDALIDNDSTVLRYRPASARMTTRGSETPLTETGPVTETASKGLKSLEKPHLLADANRIKIQSPMSVMRDDEGNPTASAQQHLSHLAQQLKYMPVELGFRVTNQEDADFCVKMAIAMTEELQVPLGKIAVSMVDPSSIRHGYMEMMITKDSGTR
jgi:chemotaxis protein MotB